VHGIWPKEVSSSEANTDGGEEASIIVSTGSGSDDTISIAYTRCGDPAAVDWGKWKVDIVLECTGIVRSRTLTTLYRANHITFDLFDKEH